MSLHLDTLKINDDVCVIYNSVNGTIESFYDWSSLLRALKSLGAIEHIYNYFSHEELEIFFEDNNIDMLGDESE